MDPMIFQFIGQYLDAALNPFITGTVGEVISTFTLFFIGGATIHLTLMGYAIGWGYVELPFSTFMKTCVKYLFIGALALNAATYSDWVVGSIQSLETGFTSAFAGWGPGQVPRRFTRSWMRRSARDGVSLPTFGKRPEIEHNRDGHDVR